MSIIKNLISALLSYFHAAACLYSDDILYWYYKKGKNRFTERELQDLSYNQFIKKDRYEYLEEGFSLYYKWTVPENFSGKMIVFSLDNEPNECPKLSLYINGKLQQSIDDKHRECVLSTSGNVEEEYNIFLSSTTDSSRKFRILASFKAVELKVEKHNHELALHRALKKVACFF